MQRKLKIGGFYRHFKGKIYQVLNIATHTETGEEFAVYKRVDDDKVWVRPIEMFLSEVDHKKYPNAAQKYRFELLGGRICQNTKLN